MGIDEVKGNGPLETINAETHGVGERKLVDRNGEVAAIKDIRILNAKKTSEPLLKTGNSYNVLAYLGDEGTVPNTDFKKVKAKDSAKRDVVSSSGISTTKEMNKVSKQRTPKNATNTKEDMNGVECNVLLPDHKPWLEVYTHHSNDSVEHTTDILKDAKANGRSNVDKTGYRSFEGESSCVGGKESNITCELKANPLVNNLDTGKLEVKDSKSNMHAAIERLYALQKADFPEMGFVNRREKNEGLRGTKDEVDNLEEDKGLFEAFADDGEASTSISKGLSFSDYRSTMSKKKKKKRIKAVKNALSVRKSKENPP